MNETYNRDPGLQNTYSQFDAAPSLSLNAYIGRTFLWMGLGLALTFVTALWVASSGLLYRMAATMGGAVLIVPAVVQLVVVIVMGVRLNKMSVTGARLCFLLYAALTGITFSVYFVAYDVTILIYAFAATALFFAGMAAVTLIFRLDLSSMRNFLFGGLIFLLLTGVAGLIFRIEALQIFECWLGIAIFIGYTAYDTQMIVRNYYAYAGNQQILEKASIFSALQLYLDFINLLIRILRIFGGRSKD